jgi:L-rhamnose mutarotase
MGRYFTGLEGRRPDEGLLLLDQVFNLEDQLNALPSTRPDPGGNR